MTIPASSRSRTTWTRTVCAAAAGRHGQPPGVLVERRPRPCSRRCRTALRLRHRGPVADDDLDPFATDLRLELVGGAAGDDLAVVDDGDRVGELVGLLEVLGREQERRALADEAADDVPHAEPAARVEAGRRLVQEQEPRPPDEGAAEVEPAAHAARVGLDDAVAGVGQVELLEQLVGPSPGLGRRQLVQPAEHPQVLAPGQVLVDRGELAGQADDLAELVRLLDDVEAGHRRPPGVGLEQGGQDPDGGGLAGAVGPEQAEDGALGDGQVEAVESADLALAGLVDLDQAFGRDRVHGHGVAPGAGQMGRGGPQV